MKPSISHRFGSGLTGVAVAYAGAAWLLIEVVATFHDLGWLPMALVNGALVLVFIGFPIVMATAWYQLRSGETAARAPSRLASLFTWRNAALGGLAAMALWGVGATVWIGTRGLPAAASPEVEAPLRVLAVLPFDNYLPDAEEQQWLVDGLHDQVIHEIQRLHVPGLRVISKTSVIPYADSDLPLPEIADRLGADAILEGSVRRDGDRLRATMQLIDAESDHHRWSEEYNASLETSFLEVQTSLATRIALAFTDAPEPEIRSQVGEAPTESPEAHRAYMRGLHLYGMMGAPASEQARTLFRKAVELDPDFALAWAGLAHVWLSSAHFGVPPHTAFPEARSAALEAVTADPGIPEGHIILADSRFHYDWDWDGAEAAFQEGLRLNPSLSTGHWFLAGLLAARGRFDEAAARIDQARVVDPLAPIVDSFGGRVLYWGRRYDEAERLVRASLEIQPEGNVYALGTLGFIHLARGEAEAAVTAFRRSTEFSGKFLPGLAMALARAGAREEALAIVERLEARAEQEYVAPYERAFAWVGLEEYDRALHLIEEATKTRDAELIWIAVEPALDPLRDHPRFQAVLRKMGLNGVPTATF